MRTTSVLSRVRAAALAVAAALSLGACDADPSGPPEALVGSWGTSQQQQGLTINQRLELGADGRYLWVIEGYGPGGRPEDGLLESIRITGDWEVRFDRLALRETSGLHWRQGVGESQLDFIGAWNTQRRVRLEGSRLSITYLPTPEQSITQYTIVFERLLGGVID